MALRADDPRLALTVEEWAEMEDPPGHRFQVIRGELDVTPGPAPEHGEAVGEIYGELRRSLPPELRITIDSDWHLAVDARVAMAPRPDLMVIPRTGPIVPVLAVEVLSPSDHHRFRGTEWTRIEAKRLDYADAGLEHYLEVDLKTCTVVRYELRDGVLVIVDGVEQGDALVSRVPYAYVITPKHVMELP
jgi:Uma2 family endonuclease